MSASEVLQWLPALLALVSLVAIFATLRQSVKTLEDTIKNMVSNQERERSERAAEQEKTRETLSDIPVIREQMNQVWQHLATKAELVAVETDVQALKDNVSKLAGGVTNGRKGRLKS